MQKRWTFDIPVDSLNEKYYNFHEIISLALKEKNFDDAIRFLCERAGHTTAGRLYIARRCLYKESPDLLKAEALLLELEQQFDSHEIAMDLCRLYAKAGKPVSSLGYLYRAKRYASRFLDLASLSSPLQDLDPESLLSSIPHDEFSKDSHGCFLLGYEILHQDEDLLDLALELLRISVHYGKRGSQHIGIAAALVHEVFVDRGQFALAQEYAELAEKCEYSLILS